MVVLKINKNHVLECYRKNGTSVCKTKDALWPSKHNDSCKCESMCVRMRRRLDA